MRLHSYRPKSHQEPRGTASLPAGGSGAAASHAPDRLDSTTLPYVAERGPTIFLETFDGDRFIDDPSIRFTNQAVDVIELWDRQWFGEIPRGIGFSVEDPYVAPTHHPPTGDRSRKADRSSRREQEEIPDRDIKFERADTTQQHEHEPFRLKNVLPWNHQASSPLPAPALTPERQAQILQELPGIGTWAGRQRLFSIRPHREPPSSLPRHPPTLETAPGEAILAAAAADGGESRNPIELRRDSGSGDSFIQDNIKAVPETSTGDVASYLQGETSPSGGPARCSGVDVGGSSSVCPAVVVVGASGHANGSEYPNEESPVVLRSGYVSRLSPAQTRLSRTHSNTSSEARHMNEAWRWRFTRKWEAEQRRAAEVDPSTVEIDEGDLDPLRYLQACGMGLDLQMMEAQRHPKGRGHGGRGGGSTSIGKTRSGFIPAPLPRTNSTTLLTSFRREGSSVSTVTMQFESSFMSAENLLAREDSINVLNQDPGVGSNPAEATRDLLSVATRGRELLQRQAELETEAAARWEQIEKSCGGAGAWAGTMIPPVEIDMRGTFPYLVLRVAEPGASASRQRFLVRGRHHATPQELLDEAINQAANVCAEHSLPYVLTTIVGAGLMEWRQDTDRNLILSPAPKALHLQPQGSNGHYGGSPPDVPSGDVSGLAASLLRQTLPFHFQVTAKSYSQTTLPNGTIK